MRLEGDGSKAHQGVRHCKLLDLGKDGEAAAKSEQLAVNVMHQRSEGGHRWKSISGVAATCRAMSIGPRRDSSSEAFS